MCELGLERGWADTVCWVHGQLDPCLGSHVKIVDEGKGNVNKHVLNVTASAKALQSSEMISFQACEQFLRPIFLVHTAQRLPKPDPGRRHTLPYEMTVPPKAMPSESFEAT
jgi:hypothetical protein